MSGETQPPRLIELINEHELGSLEAVVLLEALRCWPEDGIVEGRLVRFPAHSLTGLSASYDAIMLAARRLQRRGLVSLEIARGSVHYRLWHDVVCCRPPSSGEPGVFILDRNLIVALGPYVSRGRDVVLLLNLLALVEDEGMVARTTVEDLAMRLTMMPRSVYRSLRRLREAGGVRRVRGGWDVSPLLLRRSAT